MIKGEVGSLRKFSEFYTAETSVYTTMVVNSYFYLYGCG